MSTKEITHGASAYANSKCRCPVCRAANTERHRKEREVRGQRLELVFDQIPHGRYSTYVNWACRCDACRRAGSEENRRQRLARLQRAVQA